MAGSRSSSGVADRFAFAPTAAAGSDENTAFCETLPQFDTSSSSSLVDLGVQGGVSYGKGFVDFEYVADFVTVGCKFHHQ